MAVPHYMASGMGGIRTAGDLVARMEYDSNMKIDKAKEYVAKKLGIDSLEIADECIMRELREELKIGTVTAVPGVPRGIAAKRNRHRRARCSPRYRRQDEHREAA